jgi:nucleoside-diphosphate-sugar epimerase
MVDIKRKKSLCFHVQYPKQLPSTVYNHELLATPSLSVRHLPHPTHLRPQHQGPQAIVCGSTGISGFNTIHSLLDTPDRWPAIYALSRNPLSKDQLALLTDEQQSRIQHVSIDLGSSGQNVGKSFKDAGVEADYGLYNACLPPKTGESAMDPSTADYLVEANVPPLKNFLDSLQWAGIKPKRILLQTGGKDYGVHMGHVRTPLIGSDPGPKHPGPKFYYNQDLLMRFCNVHPETDWNIVMPAAVIDTRNHASMTTALPWGVYAAVQAHKKEPLRFSGDMVAWQLEYTHSTARLIGYLSE